MYNKHNIHWLKHLDFALLDTACLLISVAVSFLLRYRMDGVQRAPLLGRLLLLFWMSSTVAALVFRNFKNILKRGMMIEMGYTIRSALIQYAGVILMLYCFKEGAVYSRVAMVCSACLYVLLSYTVRLLYKRHVIKHAIPNHGRSLLLLVTPPMIGSLMTQLKQGSFLTFLLAGVVLLDAPDDLTSPELDALRALLAERSIHLTFDSRSSILDHIRSNWLDEVLLIMEPTRSTWALAESFLKMGITAHVTLDALPFGSVSVESIGGYNVMSVAWNTISPWGAAAKRLLDILGGIVGCLLTALIAIVIGPIIYIASPGPIFFKQKRIGRNGKVFYMYKFRSMVMNADELKAKYMAQNRVSDGMMFKLDWDPRIIGNRELPDGSRCTGIGEFIRRTSLDEFPQFFNVLKGDMSLVGTRPPTLDEWNKYELHHRLRMSTNPGITGLWQISGRSNITDFEEVVLLDTKYIAEWTFWGDIKIILKTVLVVLKHEGSM